MSATLYYKRNKTYPKTDPYLSTCAPQSVIKVLTYCFGDMPVTIDKKDLAIIMGMKAAARESYPGVFEKIIEELEKDDVESITIRAEY